jgi:ABC-type spermidine/putrescine transport system permease subunit II
MPLQQDSGLAVGALVCSLIGLISCGLVTIAGIIMGHIAYSRAKRGESGGEGMALAAMIIGYVIVALWVGFFTVIIVLGVSGKLN